MGFLIWIIVGLVAGWLAGQVMKGGGYGVVVDIILGLVGGVVGGWIFGLLGISSGGGMIGSIIVAFVGRLHPLGVALSAPLMSMFYIGGELAQSRLGLPKALSSVFQGLLLFALLGCDTLIDRRIRWSSAPFSASESGAKRGGAVPAAPPEAKA